MKWFRKKELPGNRKGTYLKYENGRVVRVLEEEMKDVTLPFDSPAVQNEKPRIVPQPVPQKEEPNWKWLRWIWLLVILGMGFATLQLFSGLASMNQKTLELQEIEWSKLELNKEGASTTEEAPLLPSNDPSATHPSAKPTSPEDVPPLDAPVEPAVSESLLFALRAHDESGTELLGRIRESSIEFMNGTSSRGQYMVRLKSTELKVNRHLNELIDLQSQAAPFPEYEELLEYLSVKAENLNGLTTELRLVDNVSVASTFNQYVDTHNELSAEADQEFIELLTNKGYEAEVIDGVIRYQ